MKQQNLPQFAQLKRASIYSGYQVRLFPAQTLERLALSAGPYQAKRHDDAVIMGLIMPDQETIGITKSLSVEERAITLVHELIHLSDEALSEEEVESHTQTLWNSFTQSQRGFFAFLAS